MQATIYIRKDNEDRWTNITDKSDWVNAMLEKSPPNSIVEVKKLEPRMETPASYYADIKPVSPIEAIKKGDYTLCKHGADPWMCKFAKPGKPCKEAK